MDAPAAPSFVVACGSLGEEKRLGTLTRSYAVDGERYELYAADDDKHSYQLFGDDNLPIGAPFSEAPDHATVTALVRAALAAEEVDAG